MGILRKLSFAAATAATLSGCVPTTQDSAPKTPEQARTQTTAVVGAGGAIICSFIKDRSAKRACFAAAAGAAVAASVESEARAAARGNCDLRRSGVRGANNPVREYCHRQAPW